MYLYTNRYELALSSWIIIIGEERMCLMLYIYFYNFSFSLSFNDCVYIYLDILLVFILIDIYKRHSCQKMLFLLTLGHFNRHPPFNQLFKCRTAALQFWYYDNNINPFFSRLVSLIHMWWWVGDDNNDASHYSKFPFGNI